MGTALGLWPTRRSLRATDVLTRNSPHMENTIMAYIARPINDRLCVGIDLHKDSLFVVTLQPATGEVRE
ncbi:MAG: hypothetical protein GC164_04055, partial [Phycisphaera sp.]|nr:hypothetical protein [Phycisphaera sp.]